MNERIKELAEQATTYIEPTLDSGEGWIFNKEKFAELIVRECLNKIENEATQYTEPVWAVELVDDIKEHFGVKE